MKSIKQLVNEPTAAERAAAEIQPAKRRAKATAEEVTRNGEPRRSRPDRAGQRLVAGYVDGDTFKSFKILCAEQGATSQAMVCEAVELLFNKYHKPITAELKQQAQERA